jgi:hypothetical protein
MIERTIIILPGFFNTFICFWAAKLRILSLVDSGNCKSDAEGILVWLPVHGGSRNGEARQLGQRA